MEPVPNHETTSHRPPEDVDVPIETPPDDVAEQAVDAVPADEDEGDEPTGAVIHRGLEVDEADAADQARLAGLDDDYR